MMFKVDGFVLRHGGCEVKKEDVAYIRRFLSDFSNLSRSEVILTGMAIMLPLIMKPAMPVSLSPTLPRERGRESTNRCASFTLNFLIFGKKTGRSISEILIYRRI